MNNRTGNNYDAEQQVLESLSNIYYSMYLIDVVNNTLIEMNSRSDIQNFVNKEKQASEQVSAAITELVDEEYLEATLEFADWNTLNERMKGKNIISFEFLGKGGHWNRANFITVSRDGEENLSSVVCAIQRIDDEKQKELDYQRRLKKTLENQNEIYAEMLHIQGCGLIASDEKGNIVTINNAAMELLGIDKSDNFYYKFFENIEAEDKEKIKADFIEKMRTDGRFSAEYAVRRPDGNIVYAMSEVRTAVLAGGDRLMINSLMDITEKKKLEQELVLLSETDALTGICNRRSGEARIMRLLSEGQKGMFCLFDVDKFKAINDNFGHTVGDKALISVARSLKKSFRGTDVVMRLGGDEFAVFVIDVDNERLGEQSIRRFFGELEKADIPEMNGQKIYVSLGAVFCREGNMSYEKIYARADAEMYICKSKKGNNFGFSKE